MRVLVVGSRNWTDYNEVMRNLTIAIEDASIFSPDDKRIVFVHTGASGAENMTTEYVGKVEKYMRQKEYAVKEELVNNRLSGNNIDKLTADYDTITSGIDSAVIFVRGKDRRAEYCISILEEMDIPTKIIRDKS